MGEPSASRIFADLLAYLAVAWAAVYLLRHFFRKYLAPSLAAFLLRRGQVAWAMRLRPAPAGKACGGSCDCK